MVRVFVYGTLRRGCSAHDLLTKWSATFLGELRTTSQFSLYQHDCCPGIVVEESPRGVLGEVFEVDEGVLEDLDYYECVAECGSSGLFRREEIELEDGTTAVAYLYNRPYHHSEKLPEGVWHE